jgi:type VI secretion system protein ImpC
MPLLNETSTPFGERTLAAIMFTDVVGFSKLVGDSEDRALMAVQRDFDKMTKLVEQSGGNVLKTLGDGMLVRFGSAVNAVACAVEIQCAMAEAGETRTSELTLVHRIGIHLGDVFVTAQDVFGNGVNIAARLQARAEPGGICISQTVFDVVKNKLTLQVNYLGTQELHHIRESIPMYLVTAARSKMKSMERVVISPPPANKKPAATKTTDKTPISTSKPRSTSMEFSVTTSSSLGKRASVALPKRNADTPMTIAILGDFSGRGSRDINEPLIGRRARHIDIDNFETVFQKLGVCIRLPAYHVEGQTTEMHFEEIEDFHPDALMQHTPKLAELWSLRRELNQPQSAARASARLREITTVVSAPVSPKFLRQPTGPESDQTTLSRLLDRAPGSSSTSADAPKAAPSSIDALIKPLLQSASAASSSPKGLNVVAELQALELELTAQLRAILHHPDFQALESAWLGLNRLVRDFGGEGDVKFRLIDVTRSELIAQSAELTATLVEHQCTHILAEFMVGADLEDLTLLTDLGRVAAESDAVLLAGARPLLLGCESFNRAPDPKAWNINLPTATADAWTRLRTSEMAHQIILSAPRVIMRQPYGRKSEEIESFKFEELTPTRHHDNFLWGSPAFACAHMLAREHMNGGRDPQKFSGGELGDLALFSYKEDDDVVVKPCAEAVLNEYAIRTMESRGITAIATVKRTDAVRVMRMVTIEK